MSDALTKTLEVECRVVVDADEAQRMKQEGKNVWSWCSEGFHNWVETRIVLTDVIAYLVPNDHILLPPDSWKGKDEPVPENDDDD